MNTEKSYEWRRQLMWGLVLIGVGVAFLLDRLDLFGIWDLWHYWPLILVVVGINKMIGYPTAKHFSSGLWTVIVGLWLFATFENMFGLTFRNSWPILIIAWGVTLVIEPMIQRRFPANEEQRNEK
ncbi:MAG: LiaI-LiaF-like domain-containing protein [Telluria sp.]